MASSKSTTGKRSKNDKFYPVKTTEEVVAEQKVQKKYDSPEAVPFVIWATTRGHTSPVIQASMRAYTTVQRATISAWDEIFRCF